MSKTLEELAEELAEEFATDWHKDCDYPEVLLKSAKAATRTVFRTGYQTAKDQLADAGKVMPEWISVKERLPEYDQLVLIYQPKAGSWVSSHDKYGWGMWENGLTCEPTHWMPLPEPPKDAKE